jgi:uncharacterized membrane protein YoaK (UPF0700 family)/anti-anti-sigma regulatory factor
MLSPGVYSFRQKSRLAISLTWIAGYVNVVVLLATSYMVSHTTGNTTHFGERFVLFQWETALFVAGVLLCFLLGAMLSAAMTESTRRRGKASNYILPVATEAALLTALGILLQRHLHSPFEHSIMVFLMVALGSLAMGLQNATITRISGSVIRTTHLTGVFTDLGIEIIHFIIWWKDRFRGFDRVRTARMLRVMFRRPTLLRIALLASVIGSFLFGVIMGAWTYLYFPAWAMAAPILFLLWIVIQDWLRPIADVREIDPLSDPDLNLAGIVRDLLPEQVGIYRLFWHRHRSHHRAPNFQRWVRSLPDHWQIIVLVLSPLTHLDTNAAMDLRLAVDMLYDQKRRLVIAGLTQAQYQVLAQVGLVHVLGRANISPDLEFAIARAMAIHQDMAHGRDPFPLRPAPRRYL